MPQEVNPMIHVNDWDFPHEPYHCDDPEKKKLVIKLAKLITDNIPRKLPGGMHENHMDFWILDSLLTKDEIKFMLSFKARRVGRTTTWLAFENDMSVEEAQKIIDDARFAANAASEELKALRKQLQESADASNINQRQAEVRRSLNEMEDKIRAKQPKQERPEPKRDILVGDTVELLKLGTKASVIGINKDGTYEIQAGIMKLKAKKSEIYLLENENPYVQKGRPKHSGREMKVAAMNPEVDLRGMDSVEAICVMDRYLDEAMRSNLKQVRIIHGKGTGVLRKAVHESLKRNKYVKKYRLGVYGEGEDGVTIAEFE